MNIFSLTKFVKQNLQDKDLNYSISLESHCDGRRRYVAMVRNKATHSWLMPDAYASIECFKNVRLLEEGVACHWIPQAMTFGGTHDGNVGSDAPVALRRVKEQTNSANNTYCLDNAKLSTKVIPRGIYLPLSHFDKKAFLLSCHSRCIFTHLLLDSI